MTSFNNTSDINEIRVNGEVLASSVDVAESFRERFRGLMWNDELEEGEALVFPFKRGSYRGIHTFAVRFPIDVVWVDDGVVTCVKRMKPWVDLWVSKGDVIIELPDGGAGSVEVGDTVTF